MSRNNEATGAINRERTRREFKGAIREIQHASRPNGRTARARLSWLAAISVGATVAWRAFQASRRATSPGDAEAETLRLASYVPVASPGTPGAVSRQRQPGIAAADDRPGGRSEPRAAADGVPVADANADQKATGFVSLVKELGARFSRDECATRAQALAFVGVMSMVPVLLFAIAAIGFFVPPEKAIELMHQLTQRLVPGGQGAAAADQVIQQTGLVASAQSIMHARGFALAAGLISLLWAGIGLFTSASTPMNAAWETKETRGFVKLRLVCLGVFLGAGLLFALSLLPSSGPDVIQHLHIPWLGLPKHPPFLIAVAMQSGFELLAWAFDIAMFAVIYKFLPSAPVTWRAAATGGVVAGLLWEFFKKGFTVYLAHFGNFNKVYGALGGIILLVTWILYSCMVLLAGAILCKMYHEHKEEGGVKQSAPATQPGKT